MMTKLAAALFLLTAGCAADSDGAFHLTGRLADPSNVTHIVATNPASGERIVIDMKDDGLGDGQFDVALPTNGSWIVTFTDSTKVGPEMRVATLQTGGIDAFGSATAGSLDFGTVKVSGHYAHGSTTWESLESALGADRAALVKLGKVDDLALRYSNPDVDGDGKIDALQGHNFVLELVGTYRMQQDGQDLIIQDLVKGVRSPSVNYLGTAIQAAVPREMNMTMKRATVTFQEPFFGTALGPSTAMIPSDTAIGQPHMKFGELDGNPLVGIVSHPDRQSPRGTYRFGFDADQLTFTDVFAPTSDMLADGSQYAVPFVRITTAKADCISGCEIGGIELSWMRNTSDGWQQTSAPSDARLDIVAKHNGARAYLASELGGATAMPWSAMPVAGSGLLRSELSYIATTDLCYVAITYTTALGMKMTSQVLNAGCY